MHNRNNILIELQSISSTLAEIPPVNPYYVPAGYFESFASKMLDLVKTEEISAVLLNAAANPYEVPDDYFIGLPEQLLSRVKSEELPSVLKDSGRNPYQVPEGYFENLAASILHRVKTDTLSAKEELESLSPLLSKLDKKGPFSTPTGYFDELTGNVVSGVKAIDFVNEELENLSPLMSSLKTKNAYKVSAEYFEDLPTVILSKVKKQGPARIVQISFGKKIMRYAAAAVIAGMIITAGILFVNNQNASVAPDTVAQSDDNLQQETQKNLERLSDDEILNFIENQTAPVSDFLSVTSSTDIDSDGVRLMLADVPDAELKQFLENYSDDKEVLTN